MSKLSELKSQINQIANNIGQAATSMNSLSQNLQNQIAAVNNAIGGASSNEDQQMVEALLLAQKSVKDAAIQLQTASNKAKAWAGKA